MNLLINGEQRTLEKGTTVCTLLNQLQLQPERVVLELNRQILSAAQGSETELHEGDQLEIIQFVGGG